MTLDIISIFRPESAKQAQREREEEEKEAAKVCWRRALFLIRMRNGPLLTFATGRGYHQATRGAELQRPYRGARSLCAQLQVRWRRC